MIISMSEGASIFADSKEVIKDGKLNLDIANRRAVVKCMINDGKSDVADHEVCYEINMDKPTFKVIAKHPSVSVRLTGKNRITTIPFDVILTYELSRKLSVKGTVGKETKVNEDIGYNFLKVLQILM